MQDAVADSLLPTEEETLLRDAARGFLDDAAPVGAFRKLRDAGKPFDPGLWREMAGMGWSGVLVPESCGGADMGHRAAAILAGEMGRTVVASPFLSTAVIAATALRETAGERGQEALRAIATGERLYALAVDEGGKHDPSRIALRADTAGNRFRLSGTKVFVVDGGVADRLLVAGRTDGTAGDTDGLTLFEIEADRPGVTIERVAMVDARDAARLTLRHVEATGADVLGQVNDGWAVLSRALDAGRAVLAAEMAGLAAGAFGITAQYLKDRVQFDRPIGSFQSLQHRAARLWCEIEVTASAVANAGRMLDADPAKATAAVSLAKARAVQTAKLAVGESVQMHGGIGMTDALDIGFFMKRAGVATEWLGDYAYHAEAIARLRGF